jgi:pilus assembly protein CpaE
VGSVGERETVLILAALRRQFDLVIADVGTHVTPISAAAVETATQVLLVATPDVLALRGVHRTTESWKRFGSRQIDDVRILLNKVSKDNDIQPETAARLLPKAPLDVWLPEANKVLERGLNHQSPDAVIGRAWWQRLNALASELRTVTEAESPKQVEKSKKGYARKRQPVKAVAEQGQSTIEFAGMLPLILLLMIILWQVGLWGISAAYAGHAADEAARAAGIGQSSYQTQHAALDAVPGWLRSGITVTEQTDSVRVRAQLPVLVPGVSTDGLSFTSTVGFVSEG